ncbi:hypothetical protein FS749_009539 [Ceratobasidium sp. UAMH 11750]|nr:hypothetical protein FS749_009539 [Ceratobasidium sp. UAMH 11750]
MKDLRAWVPAPSLPPIPYPHQLKVTPRFHAIIRPSRALPPLTRNEEIATIDHVLPPPCPSPEPQPEDDEITITAHILPSRRPEPGPEPPLKCGTCLPPLLVGWLLPCGHGIHYGCYRETLDPLTPATEGETERPFTILAMACPACELDGCLRGYLNEMVRADGQWCWQPTNQTRHYRVW